jgi:predicted metal-dependent peptidase
MFSHIASRLELIRIPSDLPSNGWAQVDSATQTLVVHPTRLATPDEWAWVFAHLMLHLGFGHDDPTLAFADQAATTASDAAVCRFQQSMKFGRSPNSGNPIWPTGTEGSLAALWRASVVPAELIGFGVAGDTVCVSRGTPHSWQKPVDWRREFALGLTRAVAAAVDVAGGARSSLFDPSAPLKPWERARRWFLSAYPLLGATMATLTVVADAELARGWDIAVAAVDPVAGELYVNPLATFRDEEWRFILAHEALHAALSHHSRQGGRDPYLFNLATDFVINGWLVEMAVGHMPDGLLYDPQFAGQSSEEVYDRICADSRRYRKLSTMRGRDKPDVLGHTGRPHSAGAGVDLDELLHRSLASGLDLHISEGRGTLPAALVQSIRALAQPPLRWDVELARWFEELFPTLEPTLSYSRASRRQSATPEIPRPGWVSPEEPVTVRTFGVVLDTSMSMNAELLGMALGAIASYASAHDVPAARVVYCDAAAYDAGYVDVSEIAAGLRVRGRGGTVLQPGIDLIERATDFPADGPILIITDGQCDVVRIRREHAFLIPTGATLPFRPKGPVFRFE